MLTPFRGFRWFFLPTLRSQGSAVTWFPGSRSKHVIFSTIFQDFSTIFGNVELICFLQRSVFSTWSLLEKNICSVENMGILPKSSKKVIFFHRIFFAAFCFTICVASGYDLSWTILQDQFFPKHHHWLNIMRIWQLDTLAHYIQIISFSYSLTSVCFQKKATEKPRKKLTEEGFPQDFARAQSFLNTAVEQRHPGALGLLGPLDEIKTLGDWESHKKIKDFFVFWEVRKRVWSKFEVSQKTFLLLLVRSIHYGCNCS